MLSLIFINDIFHVLLNL